MLTFTSVYKLVIVGVILLACHFICASLHCYQSPNQCIHIPKGKCDIQTKCNVFIVPSEKMVYCSVENVIKNKISFKKCNTDFNVLGNSTLQCNCFVTKEVLEQFISLFQQPGSRKCLGGFCAILAVPRANGSDDVRTRQVSHLSPMIDGHGYKTTILVSKVINNNESIIDFCCKFKVNTIVKTIGIILHDNDSFNITVFASDTSTDKIKSRKTQSTVNSKCDVLITREQSEFENRPSNPPYSIHRPNTVIVMFSNHLFQFEKGLKFYLKPQSLIHGFNILEHYSPETVTIIQNLTHFTVHTRNIAEGCHNKVPLFIRKLVKRSAENRAQNFAVGNSAMEYFSNISSTKLEIISNSSSLVSTRPLHNGDDGDGFPRQSNIKLVSSSLSENVVQLPSNSRKHEKCFTLREFNASNLDPLYTGTFK